ncbi:MAG: phage portal protein [Phycisphaerales bacterium]|nr:phage portal protein [Phycisphaerales bacterium]
MIRATWASRPRVIADQPLPFGALPVVTVRHAPEPSSPQSLGEVEPLIPIQDELNTRLSDRAHRVTLQSFNMYLAKGIELEGGAPARIAPGRVWLTDNTDASVEAFGGDGHSPSEDRHIDELRAAMDKISGVSPAVLGIVRDKLGHLSSAAALRIVLMGLLAKVARRRAVYGRAIEQACTLALAAGPGGPRVAVTWQDPLPDDEEDRLRIARLKIELGADPARVRRELGLDTV